MSTADMASTVAKYRVWVALVTVVGLLAIVWVASSLTTEQIRAVNTFLGCAAFALLTYRLIVRWAHMSKLSRTVVSLLTLAVLINGLGAARAAQLGIAFNELAWGALAVNFGTCVVGVVWERWLDPTGERT